MTPPGTFPKIHPFWYRTASLTWLTERFQEPFECLIDVRAEPTKKGSLVSGHEGLEWRVFILLPTKMKGFPPYQTVPKHNCLMELRISNQFRFLHFMLFYFIGGAQNIKYSISLFCISRHFISVVGLKISKNHQFRFFCISRNFICTFSPLYFKPIEYLNPLIVHLYFQQIKVYGWVKDWDRHIMNRIGSAGPMARALQRKSFRFVTLVSMSPISATWSQLSV